jgi:hypothetical protein
MNITEEFSFTNEERAFNYILTITCLSGVIFNVRTLVLELKSFKPIAHRVMIFIIFITDFIWMMCNFIIFLYQSIIDRFSYGIACYLVPFSAVFLAGGSCIIMTYIAYERYRLIVKEQTISIRRMVISLLILWSWAFILGARPLFYSDPQDFGIEKTGTGIFCMIKWYDPRPEGRFHGYASFFTCGICICLMYFFYNRIYKHYREVTNNVANASSPHREEEKTFIFKLVGIVVLFVICWTPYFFLMLIQVIQNKPSQYIFEFIATFFVYTNPTCNAIFYSYPVKKDSLRINTDDEMIHIRVKSSPSSCIKN